MTAASMLSAMGERGEVISRLFACMEIAEEEIAAAGLSRDQGQEAFRVLQPSEPLRDLSKDVYRAHARELCARVARGEDCAPATKAEALACMMQMATKAPLTQSGQAIAEHLFAELFPAQATRHLGAELAPEKWSGQVAEDLDSLCKRFRVESRRPQKKARAQEEQTRRGAAR